MKHLLLFTLLFAAACSGGGGGGAAAVPDFSLVDMNTFSSTTGLPVSPRDYTGKVSGWYFGTATSPYSQGQFGQLNRMLGELLAELRTVHGSDDVQIVGVNEVGADAGNPVITAGRSLPWLQDVPATDARAMWMASDEDLVVLDESNVPVTTYNLTLHDLAIPANYEEAKMLLRGGPPEQAPDFSVLDWSTTSPSAGMQVSPRDYIGNVSGYYLGDAG